MSRDMVQTGPTLSTPQWAGDFGSRDHLVPGPFKLDPARFRSTATVVVTTSAIAALGATTVAVTALPAALPAEAVLYFAGTKYARTSAAAAAGATSISVYALPAALASGDAATWLGSETINVPSGTLLSRTIAERDAGTGYGPFRDTDPESETFLSFFDSGDFREWDVEMYRPGAQVYENYLPDWATLSATAKAMIRTRYLATVAQD